MHPVCRSLRIAVAVLGLAALMLAVTAAAAGAFVEQRTDRPFTDVIADLEFAATERNYRLVGRNHIGHALQSAGYPGAFPASVIQMCSLEVAHELLSADPGFIRYMPCKVAAYQDGDQVVVTTLLLPEDSGDAKADAAAARVNRELREIIDYATGR